MRIVIILLPLLSAGCWTPGPGEVDPTRYPWAQRPLAPRAPPKPAYCVMTLETPASTGIAARGSVPTFEQVPPGRTMEMACREPR